MLLGEVGPWTVVSWVLLVPPAGALATWVASRLLGVRRDGVSMVASGLVGFLLGIVFAGAVTAWEWDDIRMVGLTLVFGTVNTMVIAVGLDLLRAPGTAARGTASELLGLPRALSTSATSLARYRELAGIARRNGLLARRHVDLRDPAFTAEFGPQLRATLEEAGGLFVKLGQVASTRSDLLPSELCDELAKLQSHVRPDPELLIRAQLEEELGMTPEEAFTTFDWEPLASASIAQVYAATGHGGRDWVVKVRRPGLEEQIQRDSDAVLLLARIIEHHTALGLRISPTELAGEFLAGVREELDFRIEVGNARSLAAATPPGSGVRIPEIDAARSTRKVLIEERVTGVELGDAAGLRAAGHDPALLAQRLVEAVLGQLFHSGGFHADPHPGNVIVQPDGTIALIDFGAVGHLGKQQRAVIVQLMVGAVTADAVTLRQALEQAGLVGDPTQDGALDRAIDEFLGRHVQAGGGMDASVFEDLMEMLTDFGLHPPRWMGSLGRTFVTLEGTLRTVDPGFSLVDAATTLGTSIVAPDLAPGSLKEAFEAQAFKQLPRLQRIPQRLDDLLGQAAEGRLSVRLSAFSHEKDTDTITTLVNRVVLAVLASALGLGSTILLHVDLDPRSSTGVTVNEILGYVGLTIAGVLMLRVVATIVRDGRS